jgi:hypothetical protein
MTDCECLDTSFDNIGEEAGEDNGAKTYAIKEEASR